MLESGLEHVIMQPSWVVVKTAHGTVQFIALCTVQFIALCTVLGN